MTSSSEKTILIVDDEPYNLAILKELLSKYNRLTANNGLDALVLAQENKPDLILLDIMMPDMDGFTVATRLKENQVTTNIPIIFVTAKSDVKSFIEGFDVGAIDYITKPYNPKAILQIVESNLGLSDDSDDD